MGSSNRVGEIVLLDFPYTNAKGSKVRPALILFDAIAKIASIKLCESCNRQYGTDYRSVMPANLYGPGDNYHPENSHVIPALLRRFHQAVRQQAPELPLTTWKPDSENYFVNFKTDFSKNYVIVEV